ncbi:sialic acid-binding Ig-like lectin 14 isoform X5 [Piliocolobus tephrosceles]|uniref:sialic acid-binding Ig-like lectin 14 isoform X5 n=1 Tax=Piliocolobus tephrosceles TaxID=591936 RepID=UPI000E6B18BB|nr:sialic acid-binding Ig-like lectin 14 isoform X5 [Piliocolobus tephrosceles]
METCCLCCCCPCCGGSPYYDEPVATNNPDRKVKSETQGRFRLLGDVRNKNCSLSIGDARMEDTGIYSLRVERGRDVKHTYIQNKLNLEVTALTEKPDVHFLEPLESGRLTRLSCSLPGSCGVGRPLTFSWTGDALSPPDPETTRSSELTLTPRPEDHGTNLTCQMKRRGAQVTTERTVQLNVSYAPQNLAISIFFRNGTGTAQGRSEGELGLPAPLTWLCISFPALRILSNGTSVPIVEGQSLFLTCTVDSNPPASLSWFRDGKALNPSQTSMSGILELPNIGAREGGEFTCRVQHPLGSQHLSLILSVQRSSSSCICVTEKQEGSWPLVLTLIRGALMGAGFLLTYGLSWIYYTRCGGPQGSRAERPG